MIGDVFMDFMVTTFFVSLLLCRFISFCNIGIATKNSYVLSGGSKFTGDVFFVNFKKIKPGLKFAECVGSGNSPSPDSVGGKRRRTQVSWTSLKEYEELSANLHR